MSDQLPNSDYVSEYISNHLTVLPTTSILDTLISNLEEENNNIANVLSNDYNKFSDDINNIINNINIENIKLHNNRLTNQLEYISNELAINNKNLYNLNSIRTSIIENNIINMYNHLNKLIETKSKEVLIKYLLF